MACRPRIVKVGALGLVLEGLAPKAESVRHWPGPFWSAVSTTRCKLRAPSEYLIELCSCVSFPLQLVPLTVCS